MRAILEDVRSGEVSSEEVPQPELRPGGILVRTAFSAISAGTELAHREQVEKSLLGKALARPDLVRQVVDFARTAGIKAAYQRVQSRLDTLAPLGYSCSGTVIAAGQGVHEFQPGDRVACAGAGYASHCEVNFIPKNLAVRVPDAVSLEAASLSAIGAIALQGFRQSQAVLGEVVAVIGAGLVGVLTIQLAKAAGCRVIAIDRDMQRVERARQFGADLALGSGDRDTPSRVKEFARYGSDVAIIAAASASSEPVELAANISRDRGRIVVVGTVDLGVSRKAMYTERAVAGAFPFLRTRPLRCPVRRGWSRLPRRLCALDGEAQHGGLPGFAGFGGDRCGAVSRAPLSGGAGKRRLSGIEEHGRVHGAAGVSRPCPHTDAGGNRRLRPSCGRAAAPGN